MLGFLLIASWILIFIGSVMLLIEAFGTSIFWGIGTLLLPLPVGLLFVVTHWYQAKKAFLLQMAGVILFFLIPSAAK